MSVYDDKESDYVKLRFTGKKEDWPKWSTQFMALAQLKKFKKTLLGQENTPKESEELDEESEDIEEKKKLKARTANERAYSALTLTCSETKSFRIVYNAKTTELPSGSAALAWERLKVRFEPSSGAVLTQLKQEFNESRLKNGESPDDWIERLESLQARIDQIMGGKHIKDEDMILHIVSHLPSEYDTIVDMAMKQLTLKMLTLDTLQEDLQLKFDRMKIKQYEKNETALMTRQFKGRCGLCGKMGHQKENCWEAEENKNKKPSKWKKAEKEFKGEVKARNPNIICHLCNQKGHIARFCTSKQKQENGFNASDKQEEQEKEVEHSFCFTTNNDMEEHNHNYWIGDTGASQHMKATMDGLTDLIKTETTINVGNGNKLKSYISGTFKGTVIQEDGTTVDITLFNVAYVPKLTHNLLSITKALEAGFKISNQKRILELRQNKCVIKFDRIQDTNKGYSQGIYMKARNFEMVNTAITKVDVKYELAHQLLGHPGHNTTRATALKLGWTISQEKEPCMSCPIGKA